MDQHPIPQNVTGFQFKLIGKMTVKQFGYVALGVISAVIVYYLPISGILGLLVKVILLPLFGASGAIIAFVPIDGRPIDTMAGNFMKAFFSPNQYVYRKTGSQFSFSKIKSAPPAKPAKNDHTPNGHTIQTSAGDKAQELQKLLIQSHAERPKNAQDAREATFLKSLSQTAALSSPAQPSIQQQLQAPQTTQPTQSPTAPVSPAPNKEAQSDALSAKENELKKQLDSAKEQEANKRNSQEASAIHQKTIALEKELLETHAQKQALEQEIANLKRQLIAQKTPAPNITQTAKKQLRQEPASKAHVRSIPADMNKRMGLLVSDSPNVVSGVVKDPRGNVLPNILVEIKDQADNPVRAFKTNALGNFASATSLAPGEYVITLEDPKKQQTFDEIKITLTNQVLLPLEIISYDKREQLRKELFT